MKQSVDIKFWGVRGSTPCANPENMEYGGNTSCVEIKISDLEELIVADCGTGFRNLGNQANGHGKNVKGQVFVTHPHWDHLQGFPFFKPFYEKNNHFNVYMPPQNGVGCKEILQGHLSNTFFPVSIDMLEADLDCITFEIGKMNFEHYTVEYMWAKHTVPTALYKFTVKGKIIVFAPDNELPITNEQDSRNFIGLFRKFVKGADVVIHDAQFNKEQHKSRLGWGHSDWETLVDVTKDLGIKNLILTHHDPDNDDTKLFDLEKNIQADFSDYYQSISLAKEGQVISLPF